MQISGTTSFIAHLGYPTTTFRAPMIYNPYFASAGIDAVVVPMGCRADDFGPALRAVSRMTNFLGALITMPNKIAAAEIADRVSMAARVCGAANAIRRGPDGALIADMFDGEGFVRGVRDKGHPIVGASAYISGAGGVGSAIAASLAQAGVRSVAIHDIAAPRAKLLAERIHQHNPDVAVSISPRALDTFDIIVNATPVGMEAGDPMPFAIDTVSPAALVGDVVLSRETTPLLAAAAAHGCKTQSGLDMLFAQIPAYLEFFGLPTATSARLRAIARINVD